MKKAILYLSIFVIITILTPATHVRAQTQIITVAYPNISISPEQEITVVKKQADMEITKRIGVLTTMQPLISNMTYISSVQKNKLLTAVTTASTNLANLKTKIDTDIVLASVESDVKTMTQSSRIYDFFTPQLHLLLLGDKLLSTTEKYTLLANKLQKRMQNAHKIGLNVSALQLLLTDMQNKTADAKTQAETAIANVSLLTPNGYPGNKSTLTSSRTLLNNAIQDLAGSKQGQIKISSTRQDAKAIIQELKSLHKS